MNRGLRFVIPFFLCGIVQAEEFDARVIAVLDGDTVMVLRHGKKLKIRLSNIDAPESDQPYGKASREALVKRVQKKSIHIKSQAVDKYGRLIAEISVDGKSVNEEQVRNGMAWEYSHFHSNKRYLLLSRQAQQARRGLWGGYEKPVSPEKWRKTHPSKLHVTNKIYGQRGMAACGKKHLCSQMTSCDEAKIYFIQCGVITLDGNADGVPCENLCDAQSVTLH